ncbi:unnamed protein product [Musa acuminata subsp. malaccensis]|uniref:(wild Malaysian banana) hypothetical protein n=1 Tax=Musa acuminata subsp. malaccensis TaxID=214687 RepID=A0A804KWZ4_MUSAM|nr:unnamed protein product [Musa acuminata subsp. malaccensis]
MERKGRGEGGRRYRASTWPASMDLKREHERLVIEPGLAALTYIQLDGNMKTMEKSWSRPPEELKGVAQFEGGRTWWPESASTASACTPPPPPPP